MSAHSLKLNADKTCFIPVCRDARIFDPLLISGSFIAPSATVRNLGFILDNGFSFKQHIAHTRKNA
jgi:hypothetical protein